MAEPFDTIAASVADVIDRLAKGEITEAQAATSLSPLLAAVNDGEFATRVEEIIGVMGRITGMLMVEAPPSNLLGAPGSYAWDRLNKVFYGPKDAVTGWPPGDAMTEGPPGPSIQLQTTATHIQWRVVGASTWTNLVPVTTITGPAGTITGVTVETGPAGSHATVQLGGTPSARTIALTIPRGNKGDAGREVELQQSPTHVQWRYVGDADWTDLIALTDLKGEDGQEISLQTTATHIQWRLGAGEWFDLVPLASLRGEDGREVSLQVTATHVQWRLGEGAWQNLIPLSALVGGQGNAAWSPVFATVADGERRVLRVTDWTGGQGSKPATGAYLGPLGFVATAAEATDVRGPGGAGSGDMQGANNLSDLTDDAAARTNLDVYSKGEVDGALADKADGADVYSKAASDVLLAAKADAVDTYTKTEVDQALSDKQDDLGFAPEDAANKGQPNGYAALGGDGKVPSGQLPEQSSVTFASVNEIRAGSVQGKAIDPKGAADSQAYVALTDAATVTVNLAAGINFTLLTTAGVGGSRTLGAPTGGQPGETYTIDITSDAANRVLLFNTAYKFDGATVPTLTTTAGRRDKLVLQMNALGTFDAFLRKDVR